ncbi:hypothetical protein Q1695_011522 [Nippostrongylus brasiliensis]|nr:hypothetical protein Q1695_011522 [Nippostrongylus brasiliensis]
MTSRAEAQDLTSEGFQSASSCLTASEEDDVKDSRRKSELRPSNELAERRVNPGNRSHLDSAQSCQQRPVSRGSHLGGNGQRFGMGVIIGDGFPSGPAHPNGTISATQQQQQQQQKLTFRQYREVSDSEWDAMEDDRRRYHNRPEPSRGNASSRTNRNRLEYADRVAANSNPRRIEANRRGNDTAPTQLKDNMFKNRTNNPSRCRRATSKSDFEAACRLLINCSEEEDGSDTECGEQDPSANSRDDGQRGKRRSVNIRPIATSSMEIDVFVNADISAGKQFAEYRRKGDSRHVDDLLHNNVSTFFSGATLSSGALSVLVDLYEFPPKLRSRQPNVLLRPVVIDGCAVSGCFDKDFSANWGRMKTVSWTTCKVLSMRPIYDCVMEFLLRGHKVTVVLPSFYQNVTDTLLRCKVDDPEALDVLVNLKIVKFINRAGGASVIDVIKDEVDEVDALLVSSACYDSKGDWQYAPNAAFSAQAEPSAKVLSALTKASKRMITPIFFGREKTMTIVFTYHTKEDGTWKTIPTNLLCHYTPHLDSDRNVDDAGRLCQQLHFEEQIKLLVAVKDLFEWSTLHRRGIAALLRLNFLATLV